jgi:hypothetical protein
VKWNCGGTAVGVTVLAVRSALANFDEPETFEKPPDLAGLEDRDVTHATRP